MKVTAKAKGYHGSFRDVGEVFDVPEGTKGSWFDPVPAVPVPPVEPPKSKAQKPKDDGLV